ncbi:MAG: copper-translocating P-type ATPase [Flaviaesturariibacter sp.]|nr:copper-translocating P-type ATPase [Flaviaesturariibacter sp.]
MKQVRIVFMFLCMGLAFTQVSAQKAKAKKGAAAREINEPAYQCLMKCEGTKTYKEEGKCPTCKMTTKDMSAAKKIKANYQCPMKCEGEKTYAKGEKCGVCKMTLVDKALLAPTEAATTKQN